MLIYRNSRYLIDRLTVLVMKLYMCFDDSFMIHPILTKKCLQAEHRRFIAYLITIIQSNSDNIARAMHKDG